MVEGDEDCPSRETPPNTDQNVSENRWSIRKKREKEVDIVTSREVRIKFTVETL